MSIKETIQYLIWLKDDKRKIEALKAMPDEIKAKVLKHYNDEIDRLLNDPYVYDKYYGLQNGGII